MKINLNNNFEEFDFNELNIKKLLEVKNFTFKMIIIKVNGSIIKKGEYEATIVHDGDKVDVIHLISGG
ncbi:MAG: sulfur carrier protein ThiS [Bacteroidetes bacterium]|nr:sulfur carrier protein ThiS [Bacteroidota bacterium]